MQPLQCTSRGNQSFSLMWIGSKMNYLMIFLVTGVLQCCAELWLVCADKSREHRDYKPVVRLWSSVTLFDRFYIDWPARRHVYYSVIAMSALIRKFLNLFPNIEYILYLIKAFFTIKHASSIFGTLITKAGGKWWYQVMDLKTSFTLGWQFSQWLD